MFSLLLGAAGMATASLVMSTEFWIGADATMYIAYTLLVSYMLWATISSLRSQFNPSVEPRVPPLLPTKAEREAITSMIIPASCIESYRTPPSSPTFSSRISSIGRSAMKRMRSTLSRQPSSLPEPTSPPSPLAMRSTSCPPDTSPLLVFINPKSGGKMGPVLLRQFKELLHPAQICDLSRSNPVMTLTHFNELTNFRVLVCGGDGSVGWVLQAIDEVLQGPRSFKPAVAILPLGTGNDLARVLGWGRGYSGGNLCSVLRQVSTAHVQLLDRWQVLVQPEGGKEQQLVANNYFGVGVDAQIVLDFHRQRESSGHLFMSQFINKCWYALFGGKNIVFPTCENLPTKLTLECDGRVIDLPEGIQGVVCLNIQSYGGGANLWGANEGMELKQDGHTPPSMQDKSIEVIGISSSFALALGQVGIDAPMRICQGSDIVITTSLPLPFQVDGEPQMFGKGTIRISHLNQAFMLRSAQSSGTTSVDHSAVALETLDWALGSGLIDFHQRNELVANMSTRIDKLMNIQGNNESSPLGCSGSHPEGLSDIPPPIII